MRLHPSTLLIFALLVLSCHAPRYVSVAAKPLEYPIWFWNPPTGGKYPTAVGYSATSRFHPESSVKSAIRDGIEQLAKHLSVRMSGESILINQSHVQYFVETVQPGDQQRAANQAKILAIHTTPNITLVLLGLGELGDGFSNQGVIPPSSSPPSWIEKLPSQKGYLYGRGHCNLYYHHENGWRTAEYNARIKLVLSFQAHVRTLNKYSDFQSEAFSSTQTDVVLNGIEVVGRWFDGRTQTYHVLVRAPYLERRLHENHN